MSDVHKGSRLILSNSIIPVDSNTTFLAHYDITANDVLYGAEPTGTPVYTMRPTEGKFGGGIAVEEGTTNLITNGSLEKYSTTTVAWDSSLNGNLSVTNWGTGYNGGVASANIGYHAHLNVSRFGYPVLEYIDMNSQFGSTLKHRWLGISQQLATNVSSLGWSGGTKVTYSFDMMADSVNKGMQLGLYHRTADNTANTFGSTSTTFYVNKPYEWERKSATLTLNASEWDFTQWGTLYVYGNHYKNDYEGIGWVKNIQVESKGFSTSFVNGTRANGNLQYNKNVVNPSEGTISFWFNTLSKSPQSFSRLFQLGGWSSDITVDNLEVRWGSGWSSANTIEYEFTQKDTGVRYTLSSGVLNITAHTWYFVAVTWKAGGRISMTIINGSTGEKTYKEAIATNARPTFSDQSTFMVGSGSGLTNTIIDELRIDKIERTDEEIQSWHISNQPFYPKGIYRLAY